jgi:glucuronokinase
MAAALHRFHRHCDARGVALSSRGFSLRYHTTVPRQVGLAGSSAIVTAIVRALLVFYGECRWRV